MNKVKIICDSTADLNPEDYKKLDIEVVPLEVNFGDESFLDGVNIDADTIYARVAKDPSVFPKTCSVTPARIDKVFKEWVDKGYDVIYTGIGGKMGISYQNSNLIAEENYPGRVFVLDSNNLSGGIGLLVLKMVKYRDEGKSAKEIFDLVSAFVPKINSQFVVDTLEYLHKGGRCSGATKLFGTLLSVHPIIKVDDGTMIVYKKPRGNLKLCSKEISGDLRSNYPNIDLDHIIVTHAGCPEEIIKTVCDSIKDICGDDINILVTRAGCVVSSHCGYGTIGIFYSLR